jgi:hypothetical protein
MEDQDEILAVGPFPDFRAENSRQVRGGDVLHRIVFVHNHSHVVSEAGRNRGAKKCQNTSCETDSHNSNLSLAAVLVAVPVDQNSLIG